jgi:hypothetical protein
VADLGGDDVHQLEKLGVAVARVGTEELEDADDVGSAQKRKCERAAESFLRGGLSARAGRVRGKIGAPRGAGVGPNGAGQAFAFRDDETAA